MEALSPVQEGGARVFGLHPLQTAADVSAAQDGLEKAWFMLEAEAAFRQELADWAPLRQPLGMLAPGKKAVPSGRLSGLQLRHGAVSSGPDGA